MLDGDVYVIFARLSTEICLFSRRIERISSCLFVMLILIPLLLVSGANFAHFSHLPPKLAILLLI